MAINKYIIPGIFAVSMLGAGLSNAAPSMQSDAYAQSQPHALSHHKGSKLTDEQRQQLKSIKSSLHQQLSPLIKQERSLQTQLKGKLVTQGTTSSDITSLVNQINTLRGQIFSAMTQAQLQAYQKVGVLLPMKHGKHHKPGHMMPRPMQR